MADWERPEEDGGVLRRLEEDGYLGRTEDDDLGLGRLEEDDGGSEGWATTETAWENLG